MTVEELFQQTLFDQILHYGLLVGAIFQLIAIAAIVVIPAKSDEEEEGENGEAAGGKGACPYMPYSYTLISNRSDAVSFLRFVCSSRHSILWNNSKE